MLVSRLKLVTDVYTMRVKSLGKNEFMSFFENMKDINSMYTHIQGMLRL